MIMDMTRCKVVIPPLLCHDFHSRFTLALL
jgi:hypothetical protein